MLVNHRKYIIPVFLGKMIILLYILFYFIALFAEELPAEKKKYLVMLICFILALLAGTRDFTWPDTEAYFDNFQYYTPSFKNLTPSSRPNGFTEMGFYYLGVIVKSCTNNVTVYFLFVSFFTFYYLYKIFNKYCLYPLLGICTYISRFYMGRNFMQIRAGLAYAMVVFGIKYITNRDWKRYFAIVFVASLFHSSALIAVPLYFLCLLKVKKIHIVIGLAMAFAISIFYSNVIMLMIENRASDMNVETYIEDEYLREFGLSNPMIYFQLFILIVYTFAENRMKLTSEHYYTIRNAYFYSTFILISLSCYTALSGRTSSLFATLEVVIIPSLAFSFFRNIRWVAYLGMALAISIIFYLNMIKFNI